jgi:ParB/RepB/Spo0J family partition protein
MTQEGSNRTLETRNPQQLLVVTEAHLKQYPQHSAILSKYYDKRADRGLDTALVESIKQVGFIHTPLFIVHVDELDKDVVVDGRQRVKAAINLGLEEVPVIQHTDEDKLNVALELSANFARSENTAVESAQAIRKSLAAGWTQEEVARMCGITGAQVSYILSLGDMPKIVHEYIKKGKLSETAALSLKKSVGKPAPKATGLTAIYDEKEVKAHLESLEEDVRLAGGEKIKAKHTKAAREGRPTTVDTFNKKDWKSVIASEQTPHPFAVLISFFIGDLSLAQARQQGAGHLDWLVKPVHQPKPKKVKEPKVKSEKKSKKTKEEVVEVTPEQSRESLKQLFG